MPSWPSLLESLLHGEHLSAEDARWAMDQMLSGTATPAQAAGLLVGLRAKGAIGAEVAGFVAAMLEHAEPLPIAGVVVDTAGTGGDNAHTVNISTMAAIVAAAAGARVVKHGNRAASSSSGAADVLEALGLPLDLTPARVAEVFDAVGITFAFAPVFHPAMRHVGPIRRELGIPTVFNLLGPLANPARPAAQVIGVPNPQFAALMLEVLHSRGTAALIVHGSDGLDEITLYGTTQVWSVGGHHGSAPFSLQLDPGSLGFTRPAEGALRGGDPATNARLLRETLAGGHPSGPQIAAIQDAVSLNAGAALAAYTTAGGVVTGMPAATAPVETQIAAGVQIAREQLISGAALTKLDAWLAAASN